MTETETSIVSNPVIRDRRRELRVKIKSLAEEARIIRREEQRCRDSLSRTVGHDDQRAALAQSYVSLRSHRVLDVRRESRYSLLAYAMIRGRSYRSQEAKADPSKLDIDKLTNLVYRFGGSAFANGHSSVVRAWLGLSA